MFAPVVEEMILKVGQTRSITLAHRYLTTEEEEEEECLVSANVNQCCCFHRQKTTFFLTKTCVCLHASRLLNNLPVTS